MNSSVQIQHLNEFKGGQRILSFVECSLKTFLLKVCHRKDLDKQLFHSRPLHTWANKSNLLLKFCTLSVQQLVMFDSTNKVNSMRVLTIKYQ